MKHPSDVALELLEAFDARYDADRQALLDTLVSLGLIVEDQEADEEQHQDEEEQRPNYWQEITERAAAAIERKHAIVLDADMADTIAKDVEQPTPKPSQVQRINAIAEERTTDSRQKATQEEQVAAVIAALDEGRSPITALQDLGYTYGSASVMLRKLRRDGLVPQSERSIGKSADVPRPGFDLDAATQAIEGAA